MSSQKDIQAKIAAGRARRKAERAANKRVSDSDDDDERQPKGEDDDDTEAPPEPITSGAYLGLFLGSLFFVSLPLSEDDIDYSHVGAVVVANAGWVYFLHAPGAIHWLSWFLINLLLVQWSLIFSAIPDILASVPPLVYAVGGVANAIAVAIAYKLYVQPRPPKKRADAWDLVACGLIGANIVVLVCAGVIPMSVVYHVFKSLVSLLTNFSVSQ